MVLLAPHLGREAAADLLTAAAHKSKAEIVVLLAERFPSRTWRPVSSCSGGVSLLNMLRSMLGNTLVNMPRGMMGNTLVNMPRGMLGSTPVNMPRGMLTSSLGPTRRWPVHLR